MVTAEQLMHILQFVVKAKVPAIIWSETGLGKSQIVAEVARQMFGSGSKETPTIIDLRLGQMEVGDLIGNPRNVVGADGITRTIWGLPEWWPTEGTGIIFLDEINRAGTIDVLQAVFQLVLDRKLHTHILPEGWAVLAAANPPDGEYQVQFMDPALMARFLHLSFVPTATDWLKWADGKIQTEDLVDFIRKDNKVLNLPMTSYDPKVRATPRAFELLDRCLAQMNSDEFKSIGSDVVAGLIGNEYSLLFQKYLSDNFERPVPGDNVLSNYKAVQKRIKVLSSGKLVRMDLLKATCQDLLVRAIKDKNTKDLLKKPAMTNLKLFLVDIPSDLSFAFICELRDNNCMDMFVHIGQTLKDDDTLLKHLQGAVKGNIKIELPAGKKEKKNEAKSGAKSKGGGKPTKRTKAGKTTGKKSG